MAPALARGAQAAALLGAARAPPARHGARARGLAALDRPARPARASSSGGRWAGAVAILPNVRGVRQAALRFVELARVPVRARRCRAHLGEGSEFDSLREYVPGLDPRAIDWKASARHRKLLLREFRAERNHQVVLAIDTGYLMSEPLAGIPRLDHAINAALLLGFVALKTGDRVGLYAFDERVRLFAEPRSGARAFPRLQQRTADAAVLAGRDELHPGPGRAGPAAQAALPGRGADRLRGHRHRRADDREPGPAGPPPPGPVRRAARPGARRRRPTARRRDLTGLNRAMVARDLLREREVVLLRLAPPRRPLRRGPARRPRARG